MVAPSPSLETLDNAAPSADTSPMPASPLGVMIITLQDNGTSMPVPSVSFAPVGRFTGAIMERYLTLFAQEIERAQAKVRYEQAHGPRPASATQQEELV